MFSHDGHEVDGERGMRVLIHVWHPLCSCMIIYQQSCNTATDYWYATILSPSHERKELYILHERTEDKPMGTQPVLLSIHPDSHVCHSHILL